MTLAITTERFQSNRADSPQTWRQSMKNRRHGALILVIASFVAGCNGPFPFMSGGALDGEERRAPSIWTLDEDFAVAQLETDPEAPYSVNIAYTQIEGRLYINAGDTRTTWVGHMEENPLVRLRVSDVIYLARAERVTDPAEITEFGQAWVSHSWVHRDPDDLEEVWLYRLVPR
jgi:hypothetical protein